MMGLWIVVLMVAVVMGIVFLLWLVVNGGLQEKEGVVLLTIDLGLIVVISWVLNQMIDLQASGALHVLGE